MILGPILLAKQHKNYIKTTVKSSLLLTQLSIQIFTGSVHKNHKCCFLQICIGINLSSRYLPTNFQGSSLILKPNYRHLCCYKKFQYFGTIFHHICHFCSAFWVTVFLFHLVNVYESKHNVPILILSCSKSNMQVFGCPITCLYDTYLYNSHHEIIQIKKIFT